MKGKVISFSRSHGYGFILDDSSEYVYFHIKDWNDYMKVRAGDEVEFKKEVTEKGARAISVRRAR